MSGVAVVGYTAVGVLVAGWLFVTFGRPGQTRSLVAWLGASALYVALLSLFVNLLMRAREADSLAGTLAFGFLVAFFTAGLGTSLWKTVSQARRASGSGPGATS